MTKPRRPLMARSSALVNAGGTHTYTSGPPRVRMCISCCAVAANRIISTLRELAIVRFRLVCLSRISRALRTAPASPPPRPPSRSSRTKSKEPGTSGGTREEEREEESRNPTSRDYGSLSSSRANYSKYSPLNRRRIAFACPCLPPFLPPSHPASFSLLFIGD